MSHEQSISESQYLSCQPVPDQLPPSLTAYSLTLRKALFGGKVTCRLEATAEQTGFTIPVAVVIKKGSVMPFSAEDGTTVEQLDLDFSSSTTHAFELELGKQRSPYWVCLFPLETDAQLDSPPTSELKG